jgi:cytochrome c peroxidase
MHRLSSPGRSQPAESGVIFALVLVSVLSGCADDDTENSTDDVTGAAARLNELPEFYPQPNLPEGFSAAAAELGRHLFYDTRLSLNQTQSCASCHLQELAFADGLSVAVGSTGEHHFRNAQSLTNVGYNSTVTWANPLLNDLAEQALIPIFGETPVELGMAGQENALISRLQTDPIYTDLFDDAFDGGEVTLQHIVQALAAFQTTMVSHQSGYDNFVYRQQTDALSAEAQRGLALFFSEDLECFHCHGGFNFADSTVHSATGIVETPFHNTGLYNVDGSGAYPASDPGVFEITGRPEDMGRFRAPSLRNVALTAPYFHDGSALTLDDVLDHYSRGGRLVEGENAGDGALSPLKSPFIRELQLTELERVELSAFLNSLTDEPFTTDPRLANPWITGE